MMNKKNKIQLLAWAMYDWACAPFWVIITTFIFSTYFISKIATSKIVGTYQWAFAAAISGILVAVLSPILGTIADLKGHHKRWLLFMTIGCVIFTALLWFSYPDSRFVFYALTIYVIAAVMMEIGSVFYNGYLPFLTPLKYIGRMSGWGWSLGYFGGILALIISLFIIKMNDASSIRACALLVAGWIGFFSIPLFILVPETKGSDLHFNQAIKQGFRDLHHTLRLLPQEKNLLIFLIAHLIYVDGLNTLFAFGGVYATGSFGMSFQEVILFGITLNIAAGTGAFLLAWVDDFIGSKKTILISLICLIIFGLPILMVHSKIVFWCLALVLCFFVGSVQASSRSLMARLTPKDRATELFGLYAFSGRITAFIGPWVLGLATYYFESQRAGMSTIIVFYIIGFILMLKVRDDQRLQK